MAGDPAVGPDDAVSGDAQSGSVLGGPAMAGDPVGGTRNTIGGGTQSGPVLQAQTINATFQTGAASAVPVSVAPVALAQLPPPVAGFTGRDDELAVLARLLDPAGAGGAVVVSAVAGLAGVGKTALVIQAGHVAARNGWCPGGVLFIGLHGYDESPVQPAQALDSLLRALGVPAEHIPAADEGRAALFRSVLASISDPVLVIADNASSEAQVRLLLPGAGSHRVVVTSRHSLGGLAGARMLDVTVLDEAASVELLDAALRSARPDDDRVARDGEDAARLAVYCGGLPLALQIVAAMLRAEPARRVADLAGELAVERDRLASLRYDDGSGAAEPSVAAAFELSYRRLDEGCARMLRLLPLNPGPDIATATAAVLTGLPLGQAREQLAGLARAHLIEATAAGRWQMHDLVRLYAERLGVADADADGQEEIRDRLFGYYLQMADAADDHLRALPGGEVPGQFTGRVDALAWLDAERPALVAAVTACADSGRDQVAMRLPLVLAEYFDWRRRFDDWILTTTISLRAARRTADKAPEGIALTVLGLALDQVRRFEEAIAAHRDAAAIYRETGDRHREGTALNNLGLALRNVGRFEEAIAAHQEDLAICRETGDRHGEGMALGNLSLALREVLRFEEAIAAHQDAVVIYRETGDRHREGGALGNLGLVLREVRRFEEVVAAHQEAAAAFSAAGDQDAADAALRNAERARSDLQERAPRRVLRRRSATAD